ncbi:MAG: hypothetical protein GDA46_04840 [Bdellovibrionales bacterium]|nr:hypothetical protein [Bdellovibrionales bacterium]
MNKKDNTKLINQCKELISFGHKLINEADSKINLTDFYKWQTLCQNLFISSVGARSLFFLRFSQIVIFENSNHIKSGIGILEAFKRSLEIQETNT